MMINSKHVLKSILIQEEFKPALEFHKNQAYLFQLILTMETSKKNGADNRSGISAFMLEGQVNQDFQAHFPA